MRVPEPSWRACTQEHRALPIPPGSRTSTRPTWPRRAFSSTTPRRLNCVEINYTFRRTPRRDDARGLGARHAAGLRVRRQGAPAHHARRAPARRRRADRLLSAVARAAARGRQARSRSCFSSRPTCTRDLPRLAAFLELLPPGCAPRSSSATTRGSPTRSTSCCASTAWRSCVAETERLVVPEVVTADFVYERLRKPVILRRRAGRHRRARPPAARRRPRRLPRLQARGDARPGRSRRSRLLQAA